MKCDVSDETSVVSMLAGVRGIGEGGIRGVIHSAGVIRDSLIRGGGAAAHAGAAVRRPVGAHELSSALSLGESGDLFFL